MEATVVSHQGTDKVAVKGNEFYQQPTHGVTATFGLFSFSASDAIACSNAVVTLGC